MTVNECFSCQDNNHATACFVVSLDAKRALALAWPRRLNGVVSPKPRNFRRAGLHSFWAPTFRAGNLSALGLDPLVWAKNGEFWGVGSGLTRAFSALVKVAKHRKPESSPSAEISGIRAYTPKVANAASFMPLTLATC